MDIAAICADARSFAEMPGALFASEQSVTIHGHAATQYERAVALYDVDRDDIAFAETLRALGYEWTEIKQHVARPGYRVPQLYV